MEDIVIAKTQKTPAVHFNFNENRLEISGISIPEDADNFYTPLLEWVNEYIEEKRNQPTTIILKLVYFNTSTSDYLVSILKNLKDLKDETNAELADEENAEELSNESSQETPIAENTEEVTDNEEDINDEFVYDHPLRIEWHYEEEDEDMRETGTHFESIIEIPFYYHAVEEIS